MAKQKEYEPIPEAIQSLEAELIDVESQIKQMTERKQSLQLQLIDQMQTLDIKKAENDRIRILYIAPSTRKTFDSKRFQEENAPLYEQYQTTVETKPSVRVTIK